MLIANRITRFDMISKVCSNCECLFEARRSSAKFCSPACRQQSYRERNGQQFRNKKTVETSTPEQRLTCPHCGKGYWQSISGRKRLFCSDSCRVSANRRKVNATRNLIRVLMRRGANTDPYIDAANNGTQAFEDYVKPYGWIYDKTSGKYFQDIRQNDFFKKPSPFGVRNER